MEYFFMCDDCRRKLPPPTPAEQEAFLRDFACLGLLLSGASDEQAKEIDSILDAECDGSRVWEVDEAFRKTFDPVYAYCCSPDLLEKILGTIRSQGVVGEEDVALLLYLVLTSRLLDDPLHLILRGESSAGKSFLLTQVAKLFPPEAKLEATSMSLMALYHMEPGSLKHKAVLLGERSRKTDNDAADATAAMRQLRSERQISRVVTEKVDGKFQARQIVQEGPIASVETTTLSRNEIFNEDLNRCLLLNLDSSAEQTRRVMDAYAERYVPGEKAEQDRINAAIAKLHAFQASLQKVKVRIPCAKEIVQRIPDWKPEARRFIKQLFTVIEVVTLLHQHQRKRDGEGCLIAIRQDYAVAYKLLALPLGESLGAGKRERELYEKLLEKFGKGGSFTTDQAQKLLPILSRQDARTVRKRLSDLAALGCIRQTKEGRGRGGSAEYVIEQSPDDSILPSPESLFPKEP